MDPNTPGGGTERQTPTSAAGVVIKFDGIATEDLVVILDLKDAIGNEVRGVSIENSDFIKGAFFLPGQHQFTLDNNDALLIIEQNDYTVAGETTRYRASRLCRAPMG
jgi:hypothetical protein